MQHPVNIQPPKIDLWANDLASHRIDWRKFDWFDFDINNWNIYVLYERIIHDSEIAVQEHQKREQESENVLLLLRLKSGRFERMKYYNATFPQLIHVAWVMSECRGRKSLTSILITYAFSSNVIVEKDCYYKYYIEEKLWHGKSSLVTCKKCR